MIALGAPNEGGGSAKALPSTLNVMVDGGTGFRQLQVWLLRVEAANGFDDITTSLLFCWSFLFVMPIAHCLSQEDGGKNDDLSNIRCIKRALVAVTSD